MVPYFRMRLLLWSLTVWVFACSNERTPPAPARPLEVSQTAAPAPPAVAPRAPEPAAVTEPEARALLDTWLNAQNTGDFAAYRQLYAERFDGIKRMGERVRKLDRAAWLADRERMFEPPTSGAAMRVELTDTQVTLSPSTARLRFVQRFTRGTFSDRGPKELLLVRQAGALRIAREELLSSEVIRPAAGAPTPGEFFFVIKEGLVLSQAPSNAAIGPLEMLDGNADVYVARSAVDAARLEPAELGMQGRSVRLNGLPECTARVGELSLIVRVDPHFGTTQRWTGIVAGDDGQLVDTGRKTPLDEVTREVWDMGTPILVAALEGVPSGCHPLWARDAALPVETVTEAGAEPEPLVVTEARQQIARSIARFDANTAGIAEHIDIKRVPGKRPLVVARYSRGEGCADNVAATFIWALQGTAEKPRLKLLNQPQASGEYDVMLGLDLDGDGVLELLANSGTHLLRPTDGYSMIDSIEVLSLDCYC